MALLQLKDLLELILKRREFLSASGFYLVTIVLVILVAKMVILQQDVCLRPVDIKGDTAG